MSIRWSWIVVAIVIALAVAREADAQIPPVVRFVAPGGNATNGGTSWSDAWPSLSLAVAELNASSPPGEAPGFTEIWVAHGPAGYAYTPHASNPYFAIAIQKGVIIRGGFAGTELSEADRLPTNPRTRLSGDIAGSVNSHRLVYVSMEVPRFELRFERFEFTDGDGRPNLQSGAAVWIQSSIEADKNSPDYGEYGGPFLFNDCHFSNNHGMGAGGAVYAFQADVKLRDCAFEGNTARGQDIGGGFGDARSGALELDFARLEAVNCRFTGNRVELANVGRGGAIGGFKGGFVHCVNCVFEDNECRKAVGGESAKGGAVWADRWLNPVTDEPPSPPIFTNCVFTGNAADTDGGGIHARNGATVLDCTFALNTAGGEGGGLHIGDGPEFPPEFEAKLDNSIFWGNTASGAGNALENQISPLGTGGTSGDYLIRSCCIQELNLSYWPDANIDSDPEFVDATAGDLRLRPCSPARQSADDLLLPTDALDADSSGTITEALPVDLALDARVLGGLLDMGAFEASCPADLTGDGTVSGADMGALLAAWGACSSPFCPADLDCNGIVSGSDLGTLLTAWGPCVEEVEMMSFSMAGAEQGQGQLPSLLLSYLGADDLSEAIGMLEGMSFEQMSSILDGLANCGGSPEQ